MKKQAHNGTDRETIQLVPNEAHKYSYPTRLDILHRIRYCSTIINVYGAQKFSWNGAHTAMVHHVSDEIGICVLRRCARRSKIKGTQILKQQSCVGVQAKYRRHNTFDRISHATSVVRMDGGNNLHTTGARNGWSHGKWLHCRLLIERRSADIDLP